MQIEHAGVIQRIDANEGSLLRKEFDGRKLPALIARGMKLHVVRAGTINLNERPSFSPFIGILGIRGIMDQEPNGNSPGIVFNERIYTSNEFVRSLEDFLRGNAIEVKAERFDNVPSSHINFYNLPQLCLLPVEPNSCEVNFDARVTLRMVPPDIMDAKLTEIEKEASFVAMIREYDGNDFTRLIGHENRLGSEQATFSHYVIRASKDGT